MMLGKIFLLFHILVNFNRVLDILLVVFLSGVFCLSLNMLKSVLIVKPFMEQLNPLRLLLKAFPGGSGLGML